MTTSYTATTLYAELRQSTFAETAHIELADGLEPTIEITLSNQGDLAIQLDVSGAQIMVSSALWEVAALKDPALFNRLALKLNPVNALSNIGLIDLTDGRELYLMFGEMSASSTLAQVIEEIEVLAANTIEAAELFADQLKSQ
jgi:uncharacterized protein